MFDKSDTSKSDLRFDGFGRGVKAACYGLHISVQNICPVKINGWLQVEVLRLRATDCSESLLNFFLVVPLLRLARNTRLASGGFAGTLALEASHLFLQGKYFVLIYYSPTTHWVMRRSIASRSKWPKFGRLPGTVTCQFATGSDMDK